MDEAYRQRLIDGIKKADAAGDADAVKALGAEYRRLEAGASQAPSLAPPAPASPVATVIDDGEQPFVDLRRYSAPGTPSVANPGGLPGAQEPSYETPDTLPAEEPQATTPAPTTALKVDVKGKPTERTWVDTIGAGLVNLPGSTAKLVGDTAEMAASAAASIFDGRMADTAGAALVGSLYTMLPESAQEWIRSGDPKFIDAVLERKRQAGELPGNVIDFYKDRYKDIDSLKEIIAEDPASFLSDVAALFSGGATAARGVAKAATAANAVKTASAATASANALARAATVTDPLMMAAAPARVKFGESQRSLANRVISTPVGATVSLVTFNLARDRASKMLKETLAGATDAAGNPLTVDTIADIVAAAPAGKSTREALIEAGVNAPTAQAVGKWVEDNPGAAYFVPRRQAAEQSAIAQERQLQSTQQAETDALATDIATRTKELRNKQSDARERTIDQLTRERQQLVNEQKASRSAEEQAANAARDRVEEQIFQERIDLLRQQKDDLNAMDLRHEQELARIDGDNTVEIERVKKAQEVERRQTEEMQKVELANVQQDHYNQLMAFGEDAQRQLSDLDARIQANLDEMRGGSTATKARDSVVADKKALTEQTNEMRESALSAANEGKAILDDVRMQLDEARKNPNPDEAVATEIEALERIDAMVEAGVGALDVKPIIDKLRARAREPEIFGNPSAQEALLTAAATLEKLAKAQGGTIDARTLYNFRKAGVNDVASRLGNAATDPSGVKSRAAALSREIKPEIDKAIAQAGGKGWDDYLNTYSKGRIAITQKQMAGDIARMPRDKIVDVVEGNRPEVVEKRFGKDRYDINREMAPADPNTPDLRPKLQMTASDIKRRKVMEEEAVKKLQQMEKDAKAKEKAIASSQKAALDQMDARHKATIREMEREAKSMRGKEKDAFERKIEAEKMAQDFARKELKMKQKARLDKERREIKEKLDEANAAREKKLNEFDARFRSVRRKQAKDFRNQRTDLTSESAQRRRDLSRKQEQARVDLDETLRGVGRQADAQAKVGVTDAARVLNKNSTAINKLIRATSWMLKGPVAAAASDVARMLVETKLDKKMQRNLVEAYKSGKDYKKLISRLPPAQRAEAAAAYARAVLLFRPAQGYGRDAVKRNREEEAKNALKAYEEKVRSEMR